MFGSEEVEAEEVDEESVDGALDAGVISVSAQTRGRKE